MRYKISNKSGYIYIKFDPKNVFKTATGQFTIDCIRKNFRFRGNEKVLDLGTGSGILGIVMAKLGAGKVVATDIDEKVLKLARLNAKRNKVLGKIEFRRGNWFKALKKNEKFDLILVTPPLSPALKSQLKEIPPGSYAGPYGMSGHIAVSRKIHNYLLPEGVVIARFASVSSPKQSVDIYRKHFNPKYIGGTFINFEKTLKERGYYKKLFRMKRGFVKKIKGKRYIKYFLVLFKRK